MHKINKSPELIIIANDMELESNPRYTELLLGFFALRQWFVEKQRWPVTDGDKDTYDSNLNTVNLLYVDDTITNDVANRRVITGMRLTRLDDPTQALSATMMRGNNEMHEGALRYLKGIDESQTLAFDLTRLVAMDAQNRDDVSKIKQGIGEMLGAGLRSCREIRDDPSKQIVWVYAVTAEFLKVLERMGIDQTIIAQGFASDDDRKNNKVTYFCCTDPEKSLELLSGDSKASEGVLSGLGE